MSGSFNPYHAWLGLGEHVTAPNHFELLGVDDSEDDAKVIATAADRIASRVRAFRPGQQAAEWAALLDQISEAKRCLTDPHRKAEYVQSLGGSPTRRGAKRAARSGRDAGAAAVIDLNLYPPGQAPANGNGAPELAADSPMAPHLPHVSPADAAMQPYTLPPTASAPVPYLQPADPFPAADPMRPIVPSGLESPMAPLPVALPLGTPPERDDGSSAPLPPSPAAAPLAAADPTPAVNRASATMLAARHASSATIGPVLLGLAAGLLILVVAAGLFYWAGGWPDAGQVAGVDPGPASQAFPPTPPASGLEFFGEPTGDTSGLTRALDGPSGQDGSNDARRRRGFPDRTESSQPEPAMTGDAPPAVTTSVTPPEPTPSTPAPAPPAPQPPPSPSPVTPPTTDGLPMPTKDELAKLGLALRKIHEAIGRHEFDRADAFLEVAGEMPRLPEHQAMLDRLKLLADCVRQYREAIVESLGKLASGSSFQVGEIAVGVVETSPEKIILRVNGQNRTYTILDLPVGLAAALAAQTLADDDPQTLTLKGAFVMVSPRASPDDKKKAREFLEQAAGSVEAAKDLLQGLEDQYDLTADPAKKP